MRSALYLATVSAVRANPDICAFYLRLINAGKPTKDALTVSMRKLLITLDAVARDCKPWQHPQPSDA